ncbi:folate-binding protein [Novosphingobium sp.]|uniref:CAF17-like 4Fe-4S cluster assembly/insertion protein YgfZ n=1 Tax=Novosphingobium sp. TaxID=1874826 RepID=UPI003341BBBD
MTDTPPSTRLLSRAVLRLSPTAPDEDVAAFLQGLITNDVTADLPVWAGLLTPQGKALFDFLVWRDGDSLLIDCEAAAADALVRRLSLYRLRRRITIARDDALGVFWQASAEGVPQGAVHDPRLPALGHRWIAPANGDEPGADDLWRAHRLAQGVTEGVAELGSDATLWLETNAADLGGVSFTKGCYVGQENTARMNWRQKVNRRLVVVPIDRSRPERQRAAYPDLGLAVDHLRVENIVDPPQWMALGTDDDT